MIKKRENPGLDNNMGTSGGYYLSKISQMLQKKNTV